MDAKILLALRRLPLKTNNKYAVYGVSADFCKNSAPSNRPPEMELSHLSQQQISDYPVQKIGKTKVRTKLAKPSPETRKASTCTVREARYAIYGHAYNLCKFQLFVVLIGQSGKGRAGGYPFGGESQETVHLRRKLLCVTILQANLICKVASCLPFLDSRKPSTQQHTTPNYNL